MYMYRYEKRVKYYGHIENNDEISKYIDDLFKQKLFRIFDYFCFLNFVFYLLENPNVINDQHQTNLIRTHGVGLQQAQVGTKTSFTVDTHGANNQSDDIKVVVTSRIYFKLKIENIFVFYFISTIKTNMSYGSC